MGFRPGWIGFHLLRWLADENEIVTFGFFDAATEPYVDAVIANGVYEVEVSWVPERAPAT